jgi:hypothetical protein
LDCTVDIYLILIVLIAFYRAEKLLYTTSGGSAPLKNSGPERILLPENLLKGDLP